jgi:hypothetical protein
VRFPISERARGAIQVVKVLPDRLGTQWKPQISRLDGVTGIKIQVSRRPQLAQFLQFFALKSSVEVIGMQNPDQICPLMTLL